MCCAKKMWYAVSVLRRNDTGQRTVFIGIQMGDIPDDGQVIRENHLLLRIVELYLQNGLMLPERIVINLKIQVIFRDSVTVFAILPHGFIWIDQ